MKNKIENFKCIILEERNQTGTWKFWSQMDFGDKFVDRNGNIYIVCDYRGYYAFNIQTGIRPDYDEYFYNTEKFRVITSGDTLEFSQNGCTVKWFDKDTKRR